MSNFKRLNDAHCRLQMSSVYIALCLSSAIANVLITEQSVSLFERTHLSATTSFATSLFTTSFALPHLSLPHLFIRGLFNEQSSNVKIWQPLNASNPHSKVPFGHFPGQPTDAERMPQWAIRATCSPAHSGRTTCSRMLSIDSVY